MRTNIKRLFYFLLVGLSFSMVFSTMTSCKKMRKASSRIAMRNTRTDRNRNRDSEKISSTRDGIIGQWGVEYEMDEGGNLYMGLDFDTDDTFLYYMEVDNSQDEEIFNCSFYGDFRKEGNRISYLPDKSSFDYEISPAAANNYEIEIYINEMREIMRDMSDDIIVSVNGEKLVLKDVTDGEIMEYFRE